MKRSRFRPRVEPILRRSSIRWKPPRRRAREAVFDPYVKWLLESLTASCVVCGTHSNIQGSHVGTGGTGQKRGRACDMVRMCGPGGNDCHGQWGERRLYFDPANGWDRDRRFSWARRWRVKSWHDYIVQAPIEERDCIAAIGNCIATFELQENAA